MVWWSEWLLVKQEDLGSNPAQTSIGRVLILAITVPVRFPVPFLLPEAVAAHFITRFSPFEAVRNKPTALNG